MIFTVPVHFNLTATRIGGERKQSTQAWSLVDFDIPDMSDEDVPVALRWRQDFDGVVFDGPLEKDAVGASPAGGEMHVRKIGEVFLRPMLRMRGHNAVRAWRHGDDAEFFTARSSSEMLARFLDSGIFGVDMPGETFRRRLTKNGGDGMADFKTVEYHDLERKIAAIRQRVARYVLVEGVFYEKCREPEIAVFRKDGCSFALVTTEPALVQRYDKRAETFMVEDWERAHLKARRSNATSVAKTALSTVNANHAPVIDPMESIYAEDVAWMRRAFRATHQVVGWLGSLRASEMSEELFSAYSQLNRSMFMPEGDERLDLVTDGLETVAGECMSDEREHILKAATAGIEALEERPVSLAIGHYDAVPRPR